MSGLSTREKGGLPWEEFAPWAERNLLHGFVGQPLDFSKKGDAERNEAWLRGLGVTQLLLLQQVHGPGVRRVREADLNGVDFLRILGEGDALILPGTMVPGVAIGVRTADCVPLLCATDTEVAAIHAGWRGIAAGVIEATLEALLRSPGTPLEVVIGPCAGPLRYEVGKDVIDALGPTASAVPVAGGKYLLNLAETARARANSVRAYVNVVGKSDTCTIGSSGFHSFRRDKEKMGSNLSFITATNVRSE